MKENFISEKKMIIVDCEERMREAKSKFNEGEIIELRNLVSRQNKALKMQN